MPAYNVAPYIGESIESVLAQDPPSFELIILDDGSSDGTWQIIRRFRADPRVRTVRTSHRGVAPARNRLLSLARGRWVVWHDADDVMLPKRFAAQAGFLKRHPHVGVVFSDAFILRDATRPGMWRWQINQPTRRGRWFFPNFMHGSAMVRRSLLIRAGGFDQRNVAGEDTHMWLKLKELTQFRYLRQWTYIYRSNPGQGLTQRHRGTLEGQRDRMLDEAVARRCDSVWIRLPLRLANKWALLRTNSRPLAQRLRELLIIPDRSDDRRPTGFRLDLYGVDSIHGIYGYIPFRLDAYGEALYYSPDGRCLYWKSTRRRMVLKADRRTRRVTACLEDPGRMRGFDIVETLVLHPLRFLLQPLDWHFLHAACAASPRGGVLIIGPPWAGKTTLSLKLVQHGWRLVSDETVILNYRSDAFEARAFPRRIQVKEKSLWLFPVLRKHAYQPTCPVPGKRLIREEALPAARRFKAPLCALIFPDYQAGRRCRVRRLRSAEMLKMIHRSPYPLFGSQDRFTLQYLATMQRLVATVPGYRLEYCDQFLDQAPIAIGSLLVSKSN